MLSEQKRDLIWELVITEFKVRYAGSRFGYLWAILYPLLSYLLLNLIFSNVFRDKTSNYSIHLFAGIVLWTYFAEGTRVGLNSLVSKARIITKTPVPSVVIIVAAIVHTTISYLINLVILGLFFWYYHLPLTLFALGSTFILSVLILAYVVGFSFLLAPLYVRFRDLDQIWSIALRLGFYATPIIYPLSIIPQAYQKLLWLNPMGYLVYFGKSALIESQLIPSGPLLIMFIMALSILFIGLLTHSVLKQKINEYL